MRRLLLMGAVSMVAVATSFAQFHPRKDYVWARDVSVAASPTITIDGMLNEAVWAQAESLVITYGNYDGNPGSGYKIMNGGGVPYDSSTAVLKFLSNKTTNRLYIAVVAKDSSVGGNGWENGDGILGGIYNKLQRAGNMEALHQDIFITWIDSTSKGALPNLTGGNLPSRGIVVAAASVQGIANEDTNSSGQRVADQGWTLEMEVKLDSLGYNANSATTDAVLFTMAIWDADWINTPSWIATKAWLGNEWGNNGGEFGARALLRNDVNVNTPVLPDYGFDWTAPNGINHPDIVVDGNMNEAVWANVPSFTIHYGDDALRNSYPTVGPLKSGQYQAKAPSTGQPFNAGTVTVKTFFKGDKLYVGADIPDRSLNRFNMDDFFDGLQVNLSIPTDSLRDPNVHFMNRSRFGVAIDSVQKGGSTMLWDAVTWAGRGAFSYGLQLKPGSTIDNNTDVDAGYTVEMAFDLTQFGYPAAQPNKVVALGVTYHDYDMTATDTSAYRVWWFREWPWTATPAFILLDNAAVITGVDDQGGQEMVREFKLYGNYPNPFNPSTTVRFAVPEGGIARVKVYDVLGRLVRSNELEIQSAGTQSYTFDASALASGVYYYRVEFLPNSAGPLRTSPTMKMMLIR